MRVGANAAKAEARGAKEGAEVVRAPRCWAAFGLVDDVLDNFGRETVDVGV